MQRIETRGLCLEPLLANHASEMFPLLSDPVLYRHLDQEPPASEALLTQRYLRWEARQSPDGSERWLNWIVRDEAQRPVGFVQSTVVLEDAIAWVAYVIGRAYQGRGIGYAATSAMCEYILKEYPVNQLLACVEQDNQPSIRLLQRLGFQPATASLAEQHELSVSERLFVSEKP